MKRCWDNLNGFVGHQKNPGCCRHLSEMTPAVFALLGRRERLVFNDEIYNYLELLTFSKLPLFLWLNGCLALMESHMCQLKLFV